MKHRPAGTGGITPGWYLGDSVGWAVRLGRHAREKVTRAPKGRLTAASGGFILNTYHQLCIGGDCE